MTIFFSSRDKARAFGSKNGKVVDNGKECAPGRRWGFKIHKAG